MMKLKIYTILSPWSMLGSNELIIHHCVYRTAPGSARVCYISIWWYFVSIVCCSLVKLISIWVNWQFYLLLCRLGQRDIPCLTAGRSQRPYRSDKQHPYPSREEDHVPWSRPEWLTQLMGQGGPTHQELWCTMWDGVASWRLTVISRLPRARMVPALPPDDRPPPDPDHRVGGRTNLGKMEARGPPLLCLFW